MDVSSTDSKTIVVAAKAVAKSGDGGSKSDEFATTLASMLSKTGSRMGEGSSNGLQSSSSDALEDGNVGGGDNGEEMVEARKSVHDDSHDEPDYDDDRPVETSRDDRNDYDEREPVGNDDSYRTRSDDEQGVDSHDDHQTETPDNAGDETTHEADAGSSDDDQGDDQAQNTNQGTDEQSGDADTAAAVAGTAQAALAGNIQNAVKTNDTPVAAVTTQLQAAMAAGENTKGNNQSGQATGRAAGTDGLNQALAALGKDAGTAGKADGKNVEDLTAGDRGAKTATTSKGDAKINLQNQAAANGAQTATKTAENMPRETDQLGRGTEAASTKTNQAAAIAKAIGNDTKVAVEVKVESTADTLVSRPRTSLTPTAVTDATKGGQQQTQTQGANTNTAQAMLQSGQQMAAQAGNQLVANNAAKGATAQGAAVQAASASSGAGSGAAPVTAGGGESIANLTPNQNAQQAQAAQKPARPAPSQRNVMEQVTVQITKAVNSGLDKINIQLRPASLGRVDVQLEMSGDGRISATIIADSKDTLDMLQRGARDLARALNDAGLQADSQNLNFSLRENNQQQAGNGGSGKDENLDFSEVEDQALNASDIDDPAALEAALRKLVSDGRVDIRA